MYWPRMTANISTFTDRYKTGKKLAYRQPDKPFCLCATLQLWARVGKICSNMLENSTWVCTVPTQISLWHHIRIIVHTHTHTEFKLALAEHPNHCKHTLTHSPNWLWQNIQVTVHTRTQRDQTSSDRTFKSLHRHTRVQVGSHRTTIPLNTYTHRVQKVSGRMSKV